MSPATYAGPVARAVDAAQRRLLKLPAARNRYTAERGLHVPTRDGADLLTDHYQPLTSAPRGTVLVRTPYGRGVPESLFHGRMLAARGYHVLIQSVRGTSGSSGEFRAMAQETDDAQDAVAWLREQPWFDGRLATLGGSYLGWTQWALAQDPPPELRAAVVVVGPHDFQRAVYGTGALTLGDFLGWSATVLAQGQGSPLRSLPGVIAADRRAKAAVDSLPLADAAEAALAGRAPWFGEWLAHPDLADPFWEPLNAEAALQRIDVPVLLIGGWQDLFLDQTLEQYRVLSERGLDPALTIGPWTHLDTAVKASPVVDGQALSWFDQHLAGEGRKSPTPVRIFVTGAGQWRDLPSWPPATTPQVHRLRADGRLEPTPDAEGGADGGAGADTDAKAAVVGFRYDPADPTPTVGGRTMARNAGVRDNTALEARPDVLTFTSPPLSADLEVIGAPTVEIVLSTDNPHTDLFVRLCEVDARGVSHNISDAFQRLDPNRPADGPTTVRLTLAPCAHRVPAGHALRLQLSGGSHPRYARNLGTDAPPGAGSTVVPSNYSVHCAGSSLTLPIDPSQGLPR